MTKVAAKTEFLRLLAEGLSQQEARERVGVSKTSAYRWTHPESAAEYAERAANAATCECGRGMARHATRCKDCRYNEQRRNEFIERWNAGESPFVLALDFGMMPHAVHQWAKTLRKRGYPVLRRR